MKYPDIKIRHIVEYINNQDPTGLFSSEVKIITETNYIEKGKFDFWPGYSTTWGPRYVRLSNDGFFNRPIWNQAEVLVHEAVHQKDYERLGYIQFWGNYLCQHFAKGYDGNSFEDKARKRASEFRKLTVGGFTTT